MKKNILCTVLSGLAVFAFVGEAVAQPQINRSAYFLGGGREKFCLRSGKSLCP